MQKMLLLGKDGRAELGNVGMKHVQENYDFSKFKEKWVNLMLDIYESSKNYSNILFKEVA